MDLIKLFELDKLAKKEAGRFNKRRRLYEVILNTAGRAFTGIVGPRGAGKTVLLRQFALGDADSFYLSLDTFAGADLFALAKTLAGKYGVKTLLLDEIHFLKGYEAALKSIFDFLDLRVIFTSSVALSLFESAQDLSRRVKLRYLYPFSFREYLYFKESVLLEPLKLDEIARNAWTSGHMRQGYLFDEYLKGGLFPFSLEEPDALPILENILEKIITRDIPGVAGLRSDEIGSISNLVRFAGKSAPEDINYSTIARNIGVTKYKAEQYVRLLERSFVLNPVLPAGTNVLREPKVLMCLPFRLLYRSYEDAAGGLREDFAAQALRMRCGGLHYLKSTRGEKTPDFLVEEDGKDFVVEVGGKGKGLSQFKGYRAESKLILSHSLEAAGIKKPLFLLGFPPDQR
ncbi:MAG: ATP-binding protein [Elusimicrobia bacterium]|nr:ATP-binding protein [Elusimicrobiota bacterium]